MSFEFHLPDIGEGVVEGEIVSWKVQEGDSIALDQPLVEVMTDKATVEIPAPRAGRIAKINFQEGEICPVGDVLVVIDTGASAGAEPTPVAPARHEPSSAEVVTRGSGSGAIPVVDATAQRSRVLAPPAVRRLAREHGVELAEVQATGKHGRVTRDDVLQHANGGGAAAARDTATTAVFKRSEIPAPSANLAVVPSAPSVPAQTRTQVSIPSQGQEERIPFRGVRRRIADNMARSAFTAAHFTYVEEIDVTELIELRGRGNQRAKDRGFSLSYLPFIIKAVVAGLKKWPQLNASLDESTDEIVRKKYYHIGVATQGPQGLSVIVVRDCDRRSIFEISGEIKRLSDAVRDGTATRDDLTGSTFTISSLGKLGGVLATPIINFPEVGILGVHKISERPAFDDDGNVVRRSYMNLSISLDHRLVDGWDGAMFLQDVKALLEDPTLMFMELS